MIGYGLTLLAAYTRPIMQKFQDGVSAAMVALASALMSRPSWHYFQASRKSWLPSAIRWLPGGTEAVLLRNCRITSLLAFGKDQYGLPIFANLILLALPLRLIWAFLVYRQRGPVMIMLACSASCRCGPDCRTGTRANSATTGSATGSATTCSRRRSPIRDRQIELRQRPARRAVEEPGQWRNVIYPEMARDAILFGGTDPGRFCPTYIDFLRQFHSAPLPAGARPEI